MRLVKLLGAALVAVLALGTLAAAGASAHVFEATGTPISLSVKAATIQAFTTKAGSLACSSLTGAGTASVAVALTQKVTVSYTNCVASNGVITSKPDEPITAEYELSADNSVKITLKDITILTLLAGSRCTILVKSQGPLSTINYSNKAAKEILVLADVSLIEYSAAGAGCKAGGIGTFKDGTYAGNTIHEAQGGGTISWK